MVVVLAEPAVHVLTEQVEDVTSGYIRRKVILLALSIGIAFAVSMSMLRIMIPTLKLWHFLLPGFALAAFLSFRVPPIFVGIAYDSGGVASGPMTATFILAFAQGAANAIPTANILVDGFGVIAMVAMTPLVAIQILGLIFKIKSKKEAIQS
jgi:mannose/fructose/N-acetylgalactosamine-specific phosphotransferase system component IIC